MEFKNFKSIKKQWEESEQVTINPTPEASKTALFWEAFTATTDCKNLLTSIKDSFVAMEEEVLQTLAVATLEGYKSDFPNLFTATLNAAEFTKFATDAGLRDVGHAGVLDKIATYAKADSTVYTQVITAASSLCNQTPDCASTLTTFQEMMAGIYDVECAANIAKDDVLKDGFRRKFDQIIKYNVVADKKSQFPDLFTQTTFNADELTAIGNALGIKLNKVYACKDPTTMAKLIAAAVDGNNSGEKLKAEFACKGTFQDTACATGFSDQVDWSFVDVSGAQYHCCVADAN